MKSKRPPNFSAIKASKLNLTSRKFGQFNSQKDKKKLIRGRWSEAEDKWLIKLATEFLVSRNCSVKEYQNSLTSSNRLDCRINTKKFKGLWVSVALYFPDRTVESVKCRGERLFHPGCKKGPWDSDEVKQLFKFHAEYGNKWVKISTLLDRDPNSTRDKYRLEKVKLSNHGRTTASRWTEEEEMALIMQVKNFYPEVNWENPKYNEIPLYNIPWKKIAPKLQRTKAACIEKWHAHLHGRLSGYNVKSWNVDEFSILLKAIKATGALKKDEVPWESLNIPFSAYICKRQWKNVIKRENLSKLSFLDQIQSLEKHFGIRYDHESFEEKNT